jgi:hypothetical protein
MMNFNTILFLHQGLSRTAWMFMLVISAAALVYYMRNKPLDGQFFGIIAAGEVLMLVQACLGLTILLFFGVQPGRLVHFLYGFLTILVFPAIYYYTDGEGDRRAALMWLLTAIFMFGLALRAITTGGYG